MKSSKARLEANARYDATHTVQIHLKLNTVRDEELLNILEDSGNKQGVLKAALAYFHKSGEYSKWKKEQNP